MSKDTLGRNRRPMVHDDKLVLKIDRASSDALRKMAFQQGVSIAHIIRGLIREHVNTVTHG